MCTAIKIFNLQDHCTKNSLNRLFNATGNRGNQWNHAMVDIPASSIPNDYSLVVQASIGKSYKGDIAVDDFNISRGPCQRMFTVCAVLKQYFTFNYEI